MCQCIHLSILFVICGIRVAYCKGVAVSSIIYFAFYVPERCNTDSTNKYILFCSCLSLCHHFFYMTSLEFFNAGALALLTKGVVLILF